MLFGWTPVNFSDSAPKAAEFSYPFREKGERQMGRVLSMVFLFGTGSFGLALLKNTTVFFVNLTLDSINLRKGDRRITTPEKKDIYQEFFERVSWLPRQLNRAFWLMHHRPQKKMS
jgi:hypothetical protein